MSKHIEPRYKKTWRGEYYWLLNKWRFFTKPKLKRTINQLVKGTK
jgi:hypothetical protein